MQIVDRTVPHIKIDFGFTLMELLTAIGIAAALRANNAETLYYWVIKE